jgi:hypothetical protein
MERAMTVNVLQPMQGSPLTTARKFVHRLLSAAGLAALVALFLSSAYGAAPSRQRYLICSDGTVFLGERVRMGLGTPPHTWRNVQPGAFPSAFVFQAATVISPSGVVVEDLSWDFSQGVDNSHPLVTCSFVIPIGDLAGYRADFIGYFIP